MSPVILLLTIGNNPKTWDTFMTKVDESVSKFYKGVGWEREGENTQDAIRFEDLRDCATDYVHKCRLRPLAHIPKRGEYLLDMASGPIQYDEYLEYSKNFRKRHCIDLSSTALQDAKSKIGEHGKFIQGNFLDIAIEPDFFDCSISLHTIYHIDKDLQEAAVRKLLAVTKPGAPVIIIYSNPNALPSRVGRLTRALALKSYSESKKESEDSSELYFSAHPIDWWGRFADIASIQIYPWRSLMSCHQKKLIPDNGIGKKMLSILYACEERFPNFFVRHFQYPMVVLKKCTMS